MRKTKTNGFSLPLHPFQYITYFIIAFEILVTSAILAPMLPDYRQVRNRQIIFLVVYIPTQSAVLLTGLVTTLSDPTDPVVYEHRKAIQNNESFDSSRYSSVCTICGTSVNSSSKHCGYCNRCVVRFDHHCKWLNNCIGARNYNLFLVLITSLELSQGWMFSWSLWLLLKAFDDMEWIERQSEGVFGRSQQGLVLVMVLINALFALVVSVAIGNLIALHLWLRKHKKMTTYEYILYLRSLHKYTDSKVVPRQSPGIPEETNNVDPDNQSGSQLINLMKSKKIARVKPMDSSLEVCTEKRRTDSLPDSTSHLRNQKSVPRRLVSS